MSKHYIAFANSQKLTGAPEVIQLLPLGAVTSTKGNFVVDAESYQLMSNTMQQHGVDIVVDYEHQTLSGGKAPAAGWIKKLMLTDNGIDARVEWTDEAAGYLQNRQYRYTSPVILARKSDNKAFRLLSLALTNTPAIDGMIPIVNSELFDDGDDDNQDEGDDKMDFLKKLAQLLGLPETATEDDILNAITNLLQRCSEQGDLVVNSMLAQLLGVEKDADLATVSAKVMALSSHVNYVPKADYDKVKGELDKLQIDGIVELALTEGKITPAQKDWAMQYALSDKDGFAKFVDCAAVTVPMGTTQLATNPPAQHSGNTLLVCSALGITPEDVKLYGN